MTVRGARRSSTATGYLKRARARPNLRVLTGALVERIVIEGGRAASVRFRRGGRACHAVARREVILAGGAIASPQLLMLSGIGPAADLAAKGIPVVRARVEVGRGLPDQNGRASVRESVGLHVEISVVRVVLKKKKNKSKP